MYLYKREPNSQWIQHNIQIVYFPNSNPSDNHQNKIKYLFARFHDTKYITFIYTLINHLIPF